MNVWILDNPRGVNLLFKSIFGTLIDKDLTSGLLTAFNQFTVAHFSQPIESIEMGGFRWIYIIIPEYNLLFVASDNMSVDARILKARLNTIKNTFIAEFSNIWERRGKSWDVNIDQFQPFGDVIEEFYFQWEEAELMMSLSEFYNLLGILQQLANLLKRTIEKYVQDHHKEIIYSRIEELLKEFYERPEIKDDDEIKKFSFSRESGFRIVNIDPTKSDPLVMRKNLLELFKGIIEIFKDVIGEESYLIFFKFGFIFNYIIKNIHLIKETKIDSYILTLFLM